MSGLTSEQWMEMNKKYLLVAISVVRAELSLHQDTSDGKNRMPESSPAFEKAMDELSKLEEELPMVPALKTLIECFRLSSFEEKILLICAGVELDGQFAQLINSMQGSSRQLPSFSLCLSAFPDAHWSALTPEGPLRYWNLVEIVKNDLLTQSGCSIDEHILHYLAGINNLDYRLNMYLKLVLPEGELVPSHQQASEELTKRLSRFIDTGRYPLVQVNGSNSEDKAAIVAEAFAVHGFSTFRLSLQFLPGNLREMSEFVRLWNRSAILNRYVLFVDGGQEDSLDPSTRLHLSYLIENVQGVVVLGSDKNISGLRRGKMTITLENPLREEQQNLWRLQLGPAAETMDGALHEIAAQFNLDAHTIKKLATSASASHLSNGSVSNENSGIRDQIWKVCCEHTRPNLDNLAQRIEPLATWDDLVLPEMQKAVLKEIALQVQHRQKVYYTWGFAGKSNRGLGISALFSGESGTGKTMASEVLANELKLDLYRIDLSQVVNKYIGETEKNLKKVFDAAEGSGAILLFDEADALFGKRSEVKDSHDRYSNIEVSYLLQKMEEYRGLAILTTNMKTALDKAFLRRIRFVVQFPFPDAQMRAAIWKRVFPKQTPTDGLNLQKLSALNITGGNIRNIALNATFTAAGKNQPVTMPDIQQAARNEYLKLEKQMSTAESLL